MAHINNTSVSTEEAGSKLTGLRRARFAAGFQSASAAARSLGINVSTYIAHENGNRSASTATAKLYAGEFGVSVDCLLGSGPKLSPSALAREASPSCPVKELALTVQQFIDAATATDRQIVAMPADAEKTHEQRVEEYQLRARYSVLDDWIRSKREHALTSQAQSPEGALHQLALVNTYIDSLWDLFPREQDAEGKPVYDMLRWGIHSVALVLEQLSTTPRELLAVEYYLPTHLSPFARAAVAHVRPVSEDQAERRLAELNRWMEEARAIRYAGWERADETEGDEQTKVQSIVDRCERDISAIMVEAATLVPRTLRGFALKARLLTCVHGAEETNFTTEEDTLYRGLIGQLLSAADLGRIDDGSEGTSEFMPRARALLLAEAA